PCPTESETPRAVRQGCRSHRCTRATPRRTTAMHLRCCIEERLPRRETRWADEAREGLQDAPRDFWPSGRQRQAWQADHGVAAPVPEPRKAAVADFASGNPCD